jgi:hypothetical protein
MPDLFTAVLPKKEQLFLHIKEKRWCRTSDVIKWGIENFSNRADRDARLLAQEGRIVRLTEDEERFYGFKGKEGVWRVCQNSQPTERIYQ